MTNEAIFEIVQNVILDILPDLSPEEISMGKSLKELGANSIDRAEVVTMSMEGLGIKVPMMEFSQVSNIEELVYVLSSNLK